MPRSTGRAELQPNRFHSCCYPVPKVGLLLETSSSTGALPDPILPAKVKPVFLPENVFDLQGYKCIDGYGWIMMNADHFPRCVMIPKRSQQKLRIDRSVGISPEVLNFKVFVRRVPTTWGPQESCLLLRKYAAFVVWLKM